VVERDLSFVFKRRIIFFYPIHAGSNYNPNSTIDWSNIAAIFHGKIAIFHAILLQCYSKLSMSYLAQYCCNVVAILKLIYIEYFQQTQNIAAILQHCSNVAVLLQCYSKLSMSYLAQYCCNVVAILKLIYIEYSQQTQNIAAILQHCSNVAAIFCVCWVDHRIIN